MNNLSAKMNMFMFEFLLLLFNFSTVSPHPLCSIVVLKRSNNMVLLFEIRCLHITEGEIDEFYSLLFLRIKQGGMLFEAVIDFMKKKLKFTQLHLLQ